MPTAVRPLLFLLALLLTTLPAGLASAAEPIFKFRDVGDEAGLFPSLAEIQGHAASWGDANGDGLPDLYVGLFAKDDGKTNLLFLGQPGGRFVLDQQEPLRITGRANTPLFVDLDNDGDLDLYLSNLGGGKAGYSATGSKLYRNDGSGKYTDISAASGACPEGFRGRGAAAVDYDGDGLLDLLLGEAVYYGSPKRSRLLRNKGGLKFEDVSDAVGLPAGVPGLGASAADVNGDGWPDLYLAARAGGNHLYVNDGKGHFSEPAGTAETFAWEYETGDDSTAGVAFADVDLDGRLDMVAGQHFKRPWLSGVPVRLFLNRSAGSKVAFEEATSQAGLPKLPMKAPHVELQDFDNDGRVDLYASVVKFANGKPYPLVFRNTAKAGQPPKFETAALAVNDFPTPAEREMSSVGPFFDHMIADGKIIYMAPGPSCDYDRDGRLDMMLVNWWPESRSLLLKNETPSGNWLDVTVRGAGKVNRQGIGSKVSVYEAGKLGDPQSLLGHREIALGFGYCSGHEAVAHFGLADRETCDVLVTLPHGQGVIKRPGVKANQRIEIAHE